MIATKEVKARIGLNSEVGVSRTCDFKYNILLSSNKLDAPIQKTFNTAKDAADFLQDYKNNGLKISKKIISDLMQEHKWSTYTGDLFYVISKQ